MGTTYTLVPRPTETNIVRCTWLFRHKYLADGTLSRYKARLVANGSTQLEGIDVDETFSPVVKPGIIHTVLSLATSRHWPIHQLDVKNAFLHGLFLSQRKYATEILKRAGMVSCKSSRTPVDTESKLGDDGDLVSDPTLYQSLAGSLQHLTFTHPDIYYVVQQVCLYMHDHREPNFLALNQVLRLVDLLLGDRLQDTVYFLATTYSLGPLSANQRCLVLVHRQSIVVLSVLLLKHVGLVATSQVRVLHAPSRYQYADIFTKGLPSASFEEFRTNFSIWCLPALTAGECSIPINGGLIQDIPTSLPPQPIGEATKAFNLRRIPPRSIKRLGNAHGIPFYVERKSQNMDKPVVSRIHYNLGPPEKRLSKQIPSTFPNCQTNQGYQKFWARMQRALTSWLDPRTRKKADFMGPIPRMTPVVGIKAIDELSKHSLSWYKKEEYKENDFEKVLKHINDFEHNISVLNEEVRMVKHQYKLQMMKGILFWKIPNLQQLHINIPFIEALEQMPKYAKFMKDLLLKGGKESEASKIILNEQCSAVVLNKVPPKEKDPGGFTIPCVIGQSRIKRALADLGASISLMPYSMFLQLNLGDLKPTRMCIELANKTTQFPKGIAENVMVKIDKFVFPVDFVILDMEEDHIIPIILGRPFLATAHAMIDVFNKKISFEVGDEIITFNLEKSMRFPPYDEDTCHFADIIDLSVIESIKEILP
ncbi:ribonuclease H-like domain-containing protein [Tanacetum coccineum]